MISPIAERRMTQMFSGGLLMNFFNMKDITENTWFDGDFHILYGNEVLHELGTDAEHLWARAAQAAGGSCGHGSRGTSVFFKVAEGRELALKHYCRGGFPGRWIRDRYLFLGAHKTRSFAEWRALRVAYVAGLPVPMPVSARYRRSGAAYTADLITLSCRPARPLADCLVDGALPADVWRRIGAVARELADAGVEHADLNARNILVASDTGDVFVLDFDRARTDVPRRKRRQGGRQGSACGRQGGTLKRLRNPLTDATECPQYSGCLRYGRCFCFGFLF